LIWILIVLGAVCLTAVAASYVQRRRMTRGVQVATAVRTTPVAPAGLAPVQFLLYEDNAGGYYWTIVGDRGEVLARSAGFATYAEANYAADIIHRGAATASFEDRSDGSPPAEAASRGDRVDVERWLDERGSVSREETTQSARAAGWEWPAGSSNTPGGPRR
jgi:uncharacterized protein YegP (UPF0339 family)